MSNKQHKAREVRDLIADDDLKQAMSVLRDGLGATQRVRAKSPAGSKFKFEYREVPDNGVRLTCAKMLLEYGFGKPHTRQTIEVRDERPTITSADIARRLADSGADLHRIAEAYIGGLNKATPISADEPGSLPGSVDEQADL